MVIFKTERLLVRQFTERDGDVFFSVNGDEEVMRYIRPAKSREECDRFLREVIAAYASNPLYGRWAVENKSSGDFVGSFALIPVEGKQQMQIGYALAKEHWGMGYATELSREGLRYVFTRTTIDPVYAYAQGPNFLSQKVLMRAGMKENGSYYEGEKKVVGFVLSKADHLLQIAQMK